MLDDYRFDEEPHRNWPKHQPDLYSYTITHDDGAAPNPFHAMCTLAICKPGIRSTARTGDWIVGTGSAQFNLSNHMIYAMQVDQVLSWREYNRRSAAHWPHRVPDVGSSDLVRHVGDCLYFRSDETVRQRLGVHGNGTGGAAWRNQRRKDLSAYVLIATRFLYFGTSAKELPDDDRGLRSLVKGGQGHRRQSNRLLLQNFIAWYEDLERSIGNGQHGWPRPITRRGCEGCDPTYFNHDDASEDVEDLEGG